MPDPKQESPANVFKAIVKWFKDTAEWVQEHLGDPAIAAMIREDLGLPPGQNMPQAQKDEFKKFADGLDPDKAAFDETLAQIKDLIPQFKALGDSLKGSHMDWTDVITLVARTAVVDSLRLRVPAAYAVCKLLLLITDDPDEVELFNLDMLIKVIRGGKFDPGTAERIFARLIPSLGLGLLEQLLIDSPNRRNAVDYYFGWDPAPGSPTPKADLIASRTGTILLRPTTETMLGVTHSWMPKEDGGPALFLALSGGLDITHKRDENTELKLLAVLPGQPNFLIGFEPASFKASVTGSNAYLKSSVTYGSDASPALRFGEDKKTRVDVKRLRAGVELSAESAAVTMGFQGAELVTEIGGAGDTFMKSIAGNQAKAGLDFSLRVDKNGLRIEGGAGLKATIPVGVTVGGVLTVHHINVALGPGQNGHDVGLAVTGAFGFSLGPLKGTIEGLGFSLDMSFREGNLGIVDLDAGFKPPNGIGLVVDAGVVKGGGYLFMDPARGEYAGALELSIKGTISIKAIGLLSTKMPDGSKGWSLLLLIYSEFPAIQLSWGFTLLGVGGMIGLQHGMDIEALKTGMRAGALDDILFPKNPVADAPRIINRLRAIFPPTPRALIFGPMVEIGWGTPTIISIRMGLLFQFDNVFGGDQPISIQRIILLGQMRVALPPLLPDGKEILKLLVDFYGYYDFDINRLEFTARLRDSHVLFLQLTGQIYVRADFGDQPGFLLSAGGFHPEFKAPEGTPSPIDRLGVSFSIGIVKITSQQYYALTPATVQTGNDFRITAKVGPVELAGWLGYDALIELEPIFRFKIDMRAGVEVKFKGYTLASVNLKLHLEGPGRWIAKGTVSFSILLWDVEKSFDEAWGTAAQIEQTSTNVSGLMSAAFADKGNWRAQQPQGWAPVTLAVSAGETQVLAHPLGLLHVAQKIAPLGLELQRFGSNKVLGARKFEITQVKVGNTIIPNPRLTTEYFPRSQFLDMTDAQKLSAPAFEQMAGGVMIGSTDYTVAPEVVSSDLTYETAYLAPEHPLRMPIRIGLPGTLGLSKLALLNQARFGASAKSPLRAAEGLKPKTKRKLSVNDPLLAVASSDNLQSAVQLDGIAARSPSLAEQKAKATLGGQQAVRTHAVIEAYELRK
jgi:hypothetical protein